MSFIDLQSSGHLDIQSGGQLHLAGSSVAAHYRIEQEAGAFFINLEGGDNLRTEADFEEVAEEDRPAFDVSVSGVFKGAAATKSARWVFGPSPPVMVSGSQQHSEVFSAETSTWAP